MMADYSDMMTGYSEMMEKINAIDSSSLSADDYAYYAEVLGRVNQRLAEIA